MTFMQGPGLLLLAPLIVCFFIGGGWLSFALAKAGVVARGNPRLHLLALGVAVVGGVLGRLRWDRHLPAREDGQRAGPSNFRVDFTPDRTR